MLKAHPSWKGCLDVFVHTSGLTTIFGVERIRHTYGDELRNGEYSTTRRNRLQCPFFSLILGSARCQCGRSYHSSVQGQLGPSYIITQESSEVIYYAVHFTFFFFLDTSFSAFPRAVGCVVDSFFWYLVTRISALLLDRPQDRCHLKFSGGARRTPQHIKACRPLITQTNSFKHPTEELQDLPIRSAKHSTGSLLWFPTDARDLPDKTCRRQYTIENI
ncbi:hypothetical protein F5141DRAFT_397702 [Pisolithus sp. B1]|nr:hypothetical protein F5141DRAFT_397702 [Pisolithus sp. B1]